MKLKLISDGTSIGTKLIDEDTGEQIHGISKISCNLDVKDTLSKVNVEFFNIPVEIETKSSVDVFHYTKDNSFKEPIYLKTEEKNIKITTESKDKIVLTSSCRIFDTDNKQMGAVQSVNFEATPEKVETKLFQIELNSDD